MNSNVHNTAAAEIPHAQTGNGVSDLLARAIKRHEAARAYHESSCYLVDSIVLGREPTDEEERLATTAMRAEDAALAAVCSFPATRPADIAAKFSHLINNHSWRNGYLTDDQVSLLLSSMVPAESDVPVVKSSLAELLNAYAEMRAAINNHSEDAHHPEVVALCRKQAEIATEVCGYRPITKEEQRRKAEFLRDWTADTCLTEEEQTALVASLMPEGDDA